VLLTLLTGVAYPLLVTGLSALLFPKQARGSILTIDGRAVGSELIGQAFDDPKYFWSRPSATSPVPCNAAASAGSNFAPANPQLLDAVGKRVAALRAADPNNAAPVPVDLVTGSASGLDPHVSVAAARYQVERVARARGWEADRVGKLVERYTEWPTLGVIGEARVNVLELNLALDGRPPADPEPAAGSGSRWPMNTR
jgi:K+-transporting ATPase ATPase C chain